MSRSRSAGMANAVSLGRGAGDGYSRGPDAPGLRLGLGVRVAAAVWACEGGRSASKETPGFFDVPRI
jgi:hypothetical protein